MQAKRESLSMNTVLPVNSVCETSSDAGITGDPGDTGNASNVGVESDNRRSVRSESEKNSTLALSPPRRNKRPKKVSETASNDASDERLSDESSEKQSREQKQLKPSQGNDASIEIREDRKASPSSVYSSQASRVKYATRSKLLERTLNCVVPYSRRFMDRMRALSHEYISSDQARSTRNRRCVQLKAYLKSFLTHLFSTAGLCALTVGYSLLGAVLFLQCESETYKHSTDYANSLRKNLSEDLWNITYYYNLFKPEEWKKDALKLIQDYEIDVIRAVEERGYRGPNVSDWSFPSALLYAITVITTIGYGNLTPHTWIGRLATMLYAVIGIPIMLLCLTNLGNIMAKTFRFSYRKICCCFCCAENRSSQNACKTQTIRTQIIELEERRNNEINANTGNVLISKPSPDESDANSIVKQTSQQRSPIQSVEQQSIVVIENTNDTDAERVPVWLVGVLVIGYIWGGGLMFSVFEEWDSTFIGAYFCFISLSTIGFGDYVPSKTVNPDAVTNGTDGQLILIAVCFYLVFGLSLIAMSFNLVQEEILLKVRHIAQRVGIVAHR